jgi:cytosine/adenosine deaminase-related metal-dependent hydrolase
MADILCCAGIATIGAARVMGMDKELGSIAVGKRTDLVLVDGDPTRDITAVRNTDTVVCRGVVYDPAALFTSVGMRPRVRVSRSGALPTMREYSRLNCDGLV